MTTSCQIRCCLLALLLLLMHLQLNAQVSVRSDRDSVTFTGAEFVVRNGSSHIRGYLFNTGSGRTVFQPFGKAVQFIVGATNGYPAAGSTSYAHAGFRGRKIKVWRNGRLQPVASENGIGFDMVQGVITFHPALANNEKIYVEALGGMDL